MDREFYERFVGREFCFKSFRATAWRIVSFDPTKKEYTVVVTKCSDVSLNRYGAYNVGRKHKYPASEFAKSYAKNDVILSKEIKVTLIRRPKQEEKLTSQAECEK